MIAADQAAKLAKMNENQKRQLKSGQTKAFPPTKLQGRLFRFKIWITSGGLFGTMAGFEAGGLLASLPEPIP